MATNAGERRAVGNGPVQQLSAISEKSGVLSAASSEGPLAVPSSREEVPDNGDSATPRHSDPMIATENPVAGEAMSAEMKQIFVKLIDDKGNLDMRNVTALIWANRTNPELIKAVADQLIENSNEQTVFNGIEFYMPQVAHMVIHLDVELPTSALEQFALIICQQSLHVALQLNWILLAALQDYQPEHPDGNRNPHANALFFTRCAKLLQNVERIIALGSPRAARFEEMYYRGQISKTEIELLTMQDRKQNAKQVIDGSPRGPGGAGSERGGGASRAIQGHLWHKRWHSRQRPHRHKWIRRWFTVEDRVLYCFRGTGGVPGASQVKRAVVLNHADVVAKDYKNRKYPYYFEVTSPMGNMRLRAGSRSEMEKWISVLREEAQAPPVLHLHAGEHSAAVSADIDHQQQQQQQLQQGGGTGAAAGAADAPRAAGAAGGKEGDAAADGAGSAGAGATTLWGPPVLSPVFGVLMPPGDRQLLAEQQRRRYEFFDAQRTFVRSLTDICEELRFVEDRSVRTVELEKHIKDLQIPSLCYLPLCKSTDPFKKVLRIPPGEAKAFSTKARCPALVTFETALQWVDGGAPQMRGPSGSISGASTDGASTGGGGGGAAGTGGGPPSVVSAAAAAHLPPPPANAAPLDVANYLYWTFCSSGDTQWHNMRSSMKALYGGDVDPSDLRLQVDKDLDGSLGSPKGISRRLTTMLSQKIPHLNLDHRGGDRDGDRENRDSGGRTSAAADGGAGAAGVAGYGGGRERERQRHEQGRPSVWRERARSGIPAAARSPGFPNLASLGSARFRRAPSFKSVSLSMPTFGKKPEDGVGGGGEGGGGGSSGGTGGHPRRSSWMRGRGSRDGSDALADAVIREGDAETSFREAVGDGSGGGGGGEGRADRSAKADGGDGGGEKLDDVEIVVVVETESDNDGGGSTGGASGGAAEPTVLHLNGAAANGYGEAAESNREKSLASYLNENRQWPGPSPPGSPAFVSEGEEAAMSAAMKAAAVALTTPTGGSSTAADTQANNSSASESFHGRHASTGGGSASLAAGEEKTDEDRHSDPYGDGGGGGGGENGDGGGSSGNDGEGDGEGEGDSEGFRRADEAVSYGEAYRSKVERLRRESPYGKMPGWGLERMICKSNDDLRQEVFVMQLIGFYREVFQKERLRLWLQPYRILSTGKTTGLIEVLSNSISLDGLKKGDGYAGSLRAHFERLYGPPGSAGLLAAQRRFATSLAGYSVVCYLLRIKDRHNGNIMLTARGHVVHIDFGFVLGLAPGNDFSFERAPFKLTAEYVDAMGGRDGDVYAEFAAMFADGLAAARKYAGAASTLIEIMMFQSEFPCFAKLGRAALAGFRRRLLLDVPDRDIPRRARAMVDRSYNHRGTRLYDEFQLFTNKIRP